MLFTISVIFCTATPIFDIRGYSSGPITEEGTKLMVESGRANRVRRYVLWNGAEPILKDIDHSLTIAKLKANPKELIYDWADSLEWNFPDTQLKSLDDFNKKHYPKNPEKHIQAVVECSEGTVYGLPKLTNGSYADPSILGIELYLAYQYRFCRAAAYRYITQNRYPTAVSNVWQIENELNEAFLASLGGQRVVSIPSPWANWTFLTDLLHVLKDSIHDEVGEGKVNVTMNFHTDVPEVVHRQLNLPGYYQDAVKNWSHLFLILSFDAYPCYFVADPSFGVKEVVKRMQNIQKDSQNYQVFLMETGFPVNADSNDPSQPKFRDFNFTQENQALYAENLGFQLIADGAVGYLYFKLEAQEGMLPPPGGYSKEDESMFAAIKNFYLTQNETALIDWLFGNDGGNILEVLTRASKLLSQPSKGWGLLKPDSKPRQAFETLAFFFESVSSSSAGSGEIRSKHF